MCVVTAFLGAGNPCRTPKKIGEKENWSFEENAR